MIFTLHEQPLAVEEPLTIPAALHGAVNWTKKNRDILSFVTIKSDSHNRVINVVIDDENDAIELDSYCASNWVRGLTFVTGELVACVYAIDSTVTTKAFIYAGAVGASPLTVSVACFRSFAFKSMKEFMHVD